MNSTTVPVKRGMPVKRRNGSALMTVMSAAGGAAGFALGELVLQYGDGRWHPILTIGIYFGQLALIVGLCCLLAETISPKLSGRHWRQRYARDGWKLLVPATLLMLLAAGALAQAVYGLEIGVRASSPPKDYVLLIDQSESMATTDPEKRSVQAVRTLLERLEPDYRAAVFAFNEDASMIYPMTELQNAGIRERIGAALEEAYRPIGKTDIGGALSTAMDHIREQRIAGRGVAVILVSDGYSETDAQVLASYVQEGVAVHTVGIESEEQGVRLLQRLAAETGGTYQDAGRADRIAEAFVRIYADEHHRQLVGPRADGGGLHGALRVGLVLLLGLLFGLSLGIVFDNRYLAASFMAGGAVAGLLAGLLLELGLPGAAHPELWRLAADVTLAVVLALSTLIFPYRDAAADLVRLRGRGEAGGLLRGRSGTRDRSDVGPGRQFR